MLARSCREGGNGRGAFDCIPSPWRHSFNKTLIRAVNRIFRFCGQITGMMTSQIGLFDLAEKRLRWAAARQAVLASNIANANTPEYQPRDVESFKAMLSGHGTLAPARTQPTHLSGTVQANVSLDTAPPAARAIDGNAVTLDQQLTKVADTETTQSLVTSIWKKYVSFFSLALGR